MSRPAKIADRAYERNPKAVQAWLEDEYPAIHNEAKKQEAEIHWGGEMGVRHADRKVFLIVDRHPVHHSKKVTRWLEQHTASIQMFFLPASSPERNPDELLNQDVKSNAVGR